MLKVEPKTIANSLFFRRAAGPDTTARTEPAAETLLFLRREVERLTAERDKHQQSARECEQAIRAAIAGNKDASAHRAALSRLDDVAEVLGAEISHVADLTAEVRRAAVEHLAEPIARQFEADIAATLEPYQAPEELTHV